MVTRSKVDLNDYQFNVGNLVVDETVGFHAKISGGRILPYTNRFWNSITYEMSLTRHAYSRTVYNSLDFLGDVGGLFGALGPLGAIFITMFEFKGVNIALMRSMLASDSKTQAPEKKLPSSEGQEVAVGPIRGKKNV